MSNPAEAIAYVVDDDLAIRESLSLLLSANDIPSQVFATPQEFLDNCDLSRKCCLVLDERLPGMTGLELLDRIPDREHIPVFMITGHGDEDMLVTAERKGVALCLRKPFDSSELVSCIQRALYPNRG
jgi:two-component system, LuxR family, response regulator FixJ